MNTRILVSSVIFLLFILAPYSVAQYACTSSDFSQGLAFNPDTGCPLVVYGGEQTSVFGSLAVFAFPFSAKVQGALSGDLGDIINDQTVSPPVTSIPCDLRLIASGEGQLHIVTRYQPGTHTVTATFNRCDEFPRTWKSTLTIIVLPTPPTGSVGLIDPVKSLFLRGNSVTTNTAILANDQLDQWVNGVASDGVTQAVVRINTNAVGNAVNLTVVNDQGAPSNSTDQDGGLVMLGGDVTNPSSSLTTSAGTSTQDGGAAAFAIYRAPLNFSRGAQDDGAVKRTITLHAEISSGGASTTTDISVNIVRPPIVLIHGLWSNASDAWANFVPAKTAENVLWTGLPQNSIFSVNYDVPLSDAITATSPSYPSSVTSQITRNAMGFAYNAPFVLEQIKDYMAAFRDTFGVAAVQADIVAHSMGGDIARSMVALPDFNNSDTYGKGLIHKLITIGTPHLGTPLATDLLPNTTGQDPNSCVRKVLGVRHNISLNTASISGVVWSGGIGDLVGDGVDTSGLSPALDALESQQGNQPFPIAYLGGYVNLANLAGLDCHVDLSNPPSYLCGAFSLRSICANPVVNDPLANALTSQNWQPNVFLGLPGDGIVPLTSQFNNNNLRGISFPGIIHSASLEKTLDFVGPSELDSSAQIPDTVVDLLNESTTGADFQPPNTQQ